MPSVHLLIKGKVQGVFFRASAKEVADALDVKGWVKNTAEGAVELLATGDEDALQQLIEWCKKGPDKAVIDSVAVTAIPHQTFADFRVLRGR